MWTGIAQTVERLATGWTVRGSNACGIEIFWTRSDRCWGPPLLLYNGYRIFPGGNAAGAWRWPPTPSNAQVKKRNTAYTSTPPLCLRGLLKGEIYLYLYLYLHFYLYLYLHLYLYLYLYLTLSWIQLFILYLELNSIKQNSSSWEANGYSVG
jgi:hypothetical protein